MRLTHLCIGFVLAIEISIHGDEAQSQSSELTSVETESRETPQASNPKETFWIISNEGTFRLGDAARLSRSDRDSKRTPFRAQVARLPRDTASVLATRPLRPESKVPVLVSVKGDDGPPSELSQETVEDLKARVQIPILKPTAFLLFDESSASKVRSRKELDQLDTFRRDFNVDYLVLSGKNPRRLTSLGLPTVLGDQDLLKKLKTTGKPFPQLVIVLPDGSKKSLPLSEIEENGWSFDDVLASTDESQGITTESMSAYEAEIRDIKRAQDAFIDWYRQRHGTEPPMQLNSFMAADSLRHDELIPFALSIADFINDGGLDTSTGPNNYLCQMAITSALHENSRLLAEKAMEPFRAKLQDPSLSEGERQELWESQVKAWYDRYAEGTIETENVLNLLVDTLDPDHEEIRLSMASYAHHLRAAKEGRPMVVHDPEAYEYVSAGVSLVNGPSQGFYSNGPNDLLRQMDQSARPTIATLDQIEAEVGQRAQYLTQIEDANRKSAEQRGDTPSSISIQHSRLSDVGLQQSDIGLDNLQTWTWNSESEGIEPTLDLTLRDAAILHSAVAVNSFRAIEDIPLPDSPEERVTAITEQIDYLQNKIETLRRSEGPFSSPAIQTDLLRIRERRVNELMATFEEMEGQQVDVTDNTHLIDEMGSVFGLSEPGAVIREESDIHREDMQIWRQQLLDRVAGWKKDQLNSDINDLARITLEAQISRLNRALNGTETPLKPSRR